LVYVREAMEARLKKRTLARWRARPDIQRRMDEVLALDPSAHGLRAGAGDERSLPGNPDFRRSGWSEHMLLRYLLAMDEAAGKRVLDTCCGLGWGTHLVAAVAGELVAVDLNEDALAFCGRAWKDGNVTWAPGSVLSLPFPDASFDVVLCMEAIEHFSVADGATYLRELARVCRPGGSIFGSSAFPETRREADALCATNEHHLHIYTHDEMRDLLTRTFGAPRRLTKHYFSAQKR
jgi:2-polyprenyl-3-methyl-5-hydroxy-6-metoxy-1,4-benzoquinol methylase